MYTRYARPLDYAREYIRRWAEARGVFTKAFHHRQKSLGYCWDDEKGHYRSIVITP